MRRRLSCLQRHVAAAPPPTPALQPTVQLTALTSEEGASRSAQGVPGLNRLLTNEQVATFVADGFVVLPNLVDAGDIEPAVCDEIFAMGYAQREKPGMGASRTELFEKISANMNQVMASPTVRGGLESLLGPGYFMPAWNTHLHINGTGDGGFHADGTDHGPTQTTVRDHRSRQIFGFFCEFLRPLARMCERVGVPPVRLCCCPCESRRARADRPLFTDPGDVPMENGPTAVIPGSHYPAIDRIDATTRLHRVASEDGMPQELPPHLHHVISSEDRLQADVPNKQRGPFSDASAPSNQEDVLDAADKQRLEVAAAMLGVDKVQEMKMTCKFLGCLQPWCRTASLVARCTVLAGEMLLGCTLVGKAGTVMLVHHDLFHRASRRLPEVWRPLFVLRDAVRMVEPAGASWIPVGAPKPPAEPPLQAKDERSPEVSALHRTMWRYLIGEGEERVGYQPESLPGGSTLQNLVAKITDENAADVDRLAAAYAAGRTQTSAAVGALVDLLTHPQESARRAAGYGLTVGGSLAADAMIKLLRSPPTIPARDPPVADNIDEQVSHLAFVSMLCCCCASGVLSPDLIELSTETDPELRVAFSLAGCCNTASSTRFGATGHTCSDAGGGGCVGRCTRSR